MERGVQAAQKQPQVGKLEAQGPAVGEEVPFQAFHEAAEAHIGLSLIIQDGQKWGRQVAHA